MTLGTSGKFGDVTPEKRAKRVYVAAFGLDVAEIDLADVAAKNRASRPFTTSKSVPSPPIGKRTSAPSTRSERA
ncbi:MAG: hypothetical protein P8R42_19825 [Candidatus Binatia bacterium]|nr:hypothetical protein [Candidatus Binatia bacterium]